MVQGVAEVAPVSSSAHLTLLPWLLGWPPPPDRTGFAAGLHAGSCAGIAWVLHPWHLDRRTTLLLAGTTVPAAVAGLALADAVEARLGTPGPTAALLAGAGIVLWAADRRPESHDVRVGDAALAAVAQVIALAPGVSRSGATLTALRACGVDREQALRFSLLMSLPVTAGAAALSLLRVRRPVPGVAVGAPVAGVSGALAARLALRRADTLMSGAALYRLGLAAVVAVRLSRMRRTAP